VRWRKAISPAQYPIRSSDELGALTGLFNQMIRQLSDAKSASELAAASGGAAKDIGSVLTHLSSGVLGLDDDLRLRSVNTSAVHILGSPLHECAQKSGAGRRKIHLLNSFCRTISEAFVETPNGEWHGNRAG